MAETPTPFASEIEPIIHNPIGWAQVKLSGGLQRLLLVGLVYGVAVLTFHLIIYRMARDEVTIGAFCTGAMSIMFLVSAATIFILGTSAIKKAVQRDFTSEMIQSHRLSGMSGYTAVIGYLTGPIAQTLVISLVNWLTCTILTMVGGLAPGQSIFGPTLLFIIMGSFALLCWMGTILIALATRGAVAVTGLFVLLAMGFQSSAMHAVPALGLLFGSASIIRLTAGAGASIANISEFVLVSIASQLALSVIFFLAAARKYHRDDVISFTPALDYAWVLLFCILSAIGIRYRGNQLLGSPISSTELRIQIFATLTFLALMSYLPVADAARRAMEWRRRKRRDPSIEQRPPSGYLTTSFVCTLMVVCILMAALIPLRDKIRSPYTEQDSAFAAVVQMKMPSSVGPPILDAKSIAYAISAFFLTLVTFGGFIRFVYSVTPKGVFATILIIFVFWLAPLLGDLSVEAMQETMMNSDNPRSILFASSPIGTWMSVFKPLNAPIAYGLIVQLVIAMGAIVVSRRAERRG